MPDLKEMRAEANTTNVDLERQTGASQSLVSLILSGRRRDTIGLQKILTAAIARRRRVVALLYGAARLQGITPDERDELVREVDRLGTAHLEALERHAVVILRNSMATACRLSEPFLDDDTAITKAQRDSFIANADADELLGVLGALTDMDNQEENEDARN